MTADPFQTPRAPQPRNFGQRAYGQMSIGRAFSEGWDMMKANFWSWLGMTIVGSLVCAVATAALIIPVLIVGPAIAWGFTRFSLEAYEGRARFDVLWEGFSVLGATLAGFLLFYLMYFLLGLPSGALNFFGEQMQSDALQAAGGLFYLVTLAISMRLGLSVFFIVEQRLNGLDAIQAAWRATSGQWWKLIGFAIVSFIVIFLGALLLGIGAIPATAVVTFANVSMYRQLVGPAA